MSIPHPKEAPLTARAPQLRRLTKSIEGIRASGSGLLLSGEPGIGKSALLDAARERAAALGLRVLHTSGVQAEAGMPMAGLHRLLRPLAAEVEVLAAGHRTALVSAFSLGQAQDAETLQVAAAALELLCASAAECPIVVVVDDLQWLDSGSREVITFVARRLAATPIVLLGALRDGYAADLGDLGIPGLELPRLGPDEAADLLGARAPGMAPGMQSLILAEAVGNPLAIIELPDRTTVAALEQGRSGALPVTTRVERAFGGRISEMPPATAALLLVCAADESAHTSELFKAAEILTGERMTLDALQPAVDAKLVDVDDSGVSFRHPLMRSAIYQAVGLQARHSAHSALAEVLADQQDRAVWNRAASLLGADETVAQQLEDRAWRARERGAVLDAATSLGRAAALSANEELRGARLLQAAELAFEVGRADLVESFVDDTQRLHLSPVDRARSENLRTITPDGALGEGERVGWLVTQAEQANSDGDPDAALGLLLGASLRGWWGDPGADVRERLLAAADQTQVDADDPRMLATIAVAAPLTRGAVVMERLPAATRASLGDSGAAHLLGRAAHAVADFEGSLQIFAAVDDGLREDGRLGLLTHVVTMRAWSSMLLGEWDAALTAAAEGLRLGRQTGQPIWSAIALITLAALAGVRGDEERAQALAADAESVLLPARMSGGLALLQIARGLTDLSAGRYEEAYTQLARCFDQGDPAHHYREQYGAIGFLADAATLTGRQTEARGILETLEAQTERSRGSGLAAGLFYARPLVAADADADQAFEHVLRAESALSPFDRARLNLFYGMWLRRRRRVVESRDPLRLARDAFDALDAPSWGARARQELRAAGDPNSTHAHTMWADLSSQELQIAQMAAAGLSNRDIGQRLSLSHRTVASHLHRTFPKLGITSRSQLNAVLPGRSAASGS